MTRRVLVVFVATVLVACAAFAQMNPLATLTGKVTAEGSALPGVTITVTSPNLQGTRTAISTETGEYLLPLLPPGTYTVRFELSGMQPVKRTVTLSAARTEKVDMVMKPSTMTEAITVTADTPITATVESTQVSANFKQDFVENLPIPRTVQSIALLAPGINDQGPGGNIMISGAMSFDSLYLVNGVIVNENLRGQPQNLFIEDAIQETTTMTAGISAEYGHFTGGVVNALTKSGGNDFKGSFRSNFSNESWSAKTPFTVDQDNKTNKIYEATLGGPFLRDRLWFFGAGRNAKTEQLRQTQPGLARAGDQDANGNALAVGTPLPVATYPNGTKENRYEVKLTGAVTPKHTLVASYLKIAASETNQTGQVIMDLDSLVKERETPNTLLGLNYNGMLSNSFFAEAQYSKKKFAFLHSGSPYYDIIKGTLITDRARGTRYWSPTFRATEDGEHRDIQDYSIKGTYFLSTAAYGTHELKAGYERFEEQRRVNNYQNGSDYRISVANTIVRGTTIYPRMAGGSTGTLTRISWLPIFVLSKGSLYTTKSAYVNDKWNFSDKWTINAGLRMDKNHALSGDHTMVIADDTAYNPRLAVQFDTWGNGRLVFNTSYAHYVGRLAEGAINDGDPAGRNASLQWDYRGPSINNDATVPTSQLVPTDQAIKQVMDWFFANGGTDRRPFRTTPSVPGVESVLDLNAIKSPMVKEFAFGTGYMLGNKGFVRGDVIWRDWDNFYTSYRDMTTGKVTDKYGTTYDKSVVRTNSDVYNRSYRALQLQANYRIAKPWNLGLNYTLSKLRGNVTGEDSGSGPLVGVAGEYPEYRQASWNYPTGYLTGDQRHRARAWVSYDLNSPIGQFNFSLLENFNSGTATSVDGAIDSRPYVTNPGYLTPATGLSYFFGGRGNMTTESITRTDFALNYKIKVAAVEIFFQPEVINLFNEQGVVSFDEEVLTNYDCPTSGSGSGGCPAGGLKPFNPFTETPVEGVHYIKGPNFGKPTGEGDYQTPRTYRFSIGVRF